MVGIVAGLVPISPSPITINTFYKVVKRRVSGILRPKSMSSTISTYITPLITIITNYQIQLAKHFPVLQVSARHFGNLDLSDFRIFLEAISEENLQKATRGE